MYYYKIYRLVCVFFPNDKLTLTQKVGAREIRGRTLEDFGL